MPSYMGPLEGKGNLTYEAKGNGIERSFNINNTKNIMHQNLLFDKSEIKYYSYFNRFGFIDPYNTEQIAKEYVFFTKPDLYLFNATSYADCGPDTLGYTLQKIPYFKESAIRHKNSMLQLQYSVKDENGAYNPFRNLLTNSINGKMDLPGIQAESQSSTPNIYGMTIDYRSHSIKSDNAFDFSISFTDTAYLEIYHMAKIYDEYMRMNKMGEIIYDSDSHKEYIKARVIPEQFSIYKFVVSSDGETILYYAKATGCYFVDVPRSDFGDPPNDGFKFSLSFHANFIEDNNPLILDEFNKISPAGNIFSGYLDVYDNLGINNAWAKYPCIRSYTAAEDKRVARRGTNKDYRLKWIGADTYVENNVDYNAMAANAATNIATSVSNAMYRYGNRIINLYTR